MGKIAKKYLSIILAISLMGSGAVFASDSNEIDEPSQWFLRDLSMARSFGIGDEDSFSLYQDSINSEEFQAIDDSLRKILSIESINLSSDFNGSRKDVILAFYQTTKDAFVKNNRADIVEGMYPEPLVYFLSKDIIFGDDNGFSLERRCSKEEVLAIANRVYENILRELGTATSGLAWEVSDGDNTIYLFGSLHFGNNNIYPLSKEVMDAYKKSENVVFEIDNTKMVDMITYLQSIMLLEDNQTVDQILDAKTYKSYAEIMEQFGIPKEVYDKLDLWYATMLISSTQVKNAIYTQEGATPALGIEDFFLLNANNKEILELEGAKYQFDMMEGYSKALQLEQLKATIESTVSNGLDDITQASDDQREYISLLMEAWNKGDAEKLGHLIYDPVEIQSKSSSTAKEFNDKMYFVRNNEMTDKVISMLSDDSEDYFVVAGAAHMVGDSGIVKQLRDKGYTVRQLNN